MVHNILVIGQGLSLLAAVFFAGYSWCLLRTHERDIKRYRQIKEEAERETAKYAKHE